MRTLRAGAFKFKERGFFFSGLTSSRGALHLPGRAAQPPCGDADLSPAPAERNRNLPPCPKSKETPWGKHRVTAGGGKRLSHYKRALKTSLPK